MIVRDLRFAGAWRFGGFVLLVAALVALLTPGGGPAVIKLGNADKLAHLVGFFGITMWFAGVYARRRWLHVAVGMLAFGVLTEVAQGLLTRARAADPADFVADALGVGLALVIARTGLDGWAGWIERLLVRA